MTQSLRLIRAATAFAAVAALCVPLAGCGARDRADGMGGDSARRAGDDELRAAHRDFQDAVARRMEKIEAGLKELGERIKNATADERVRLQKLNDELVVKKNEAAEDLRRLRESASDKWDEWRDKTERGIADLERKLADAVR